MAREIINHWIVYRTNRLAPARGAPTFCGFVEARYHDRAHELAKEQFGPGIYKVNGVSHKVRRSIEEALVRPTAVLKEIQDIRKKLKEFM